ncbi:alpha/beta fold hydrolase [Paraglaciecola sp.]|uniref:alpha/beta fold hydrolase n=1 Tax=Paraglaciecola sp. TaxID=1920173 RepID=UPI003EF89FC8
MQHEFECQLRHYTIRGIGFGNPNKPMILALHGWLDNAASFVPIAANLEDFYVLAIDMTGHGKSQHRSADAHYHLVDFVQDIHELVTVQNWSSFILMGHSMGGIIASLYASAFPSKIRKLICIESFGPMTKEAMTSATQLEESIISRLQIQSTQSKPIKSVDKTIKARALVGHMSIESASLLVKRNIKQKDGCLVFSSDKRLRTYSSLRMTEEQAEGFMRRIICPVLVISGKQGFDFVQQAVTSRQAWVTDVLHISCEGHHHLHMDNSAIVAQHVHRFLIYQ